MDNFKTRLIEEESQLKEKMTKLSEFIDSEAYTKIKPFQQIMLRIQVTAMKTYWTCLAARISQM